MDLTNFNSDEKKELIKARIISINDEKEKRNKINFLNIKIKESIRQKTDDNIDINKIKDEEEGYKKSFLELSQASKLGNKKKKKKKLKVEEEKEKEKEIQRQKEIEKERQKE